MERSANRLRGPIPPLLGAATLFAVYRLFPDALHNFDGLMFSGIIAERASGWERALFQDAAHFLFNPTAWLFHKVLTLARPGLAGHESIQVMNALLGAGTVAAMERPLRRSAGAALSVPLALLLAHGYIFWSRAAECSVYMPALACEAGALVLAWEWNVSGSRPALAGMAAAVGLACLYHLQSLFWAPAFFLFVWIKDRRALPLFGLIFFLVGVVPQLVAFDLYTPADWVQWYRRQGGGTEVTWGNHPGGNWGWNLGHHPAALFQLLWTWPPPQASWPLFGLLSAAVLLAVFLAAASAPQDPPQTADRPLRVLLGAMALGLLFFQSVWAFELTKYAALAPVAALAAALRLGAARPRGRTLPAGLWALWGLTFAYNAAGAMAPLSRPWASQPERRDARWAARVTPSPSAIVDADPGAGLRKLFLTGFEGRGLISLPHYRILLPPEEADARAEAAVRDEISRGVPVYLLSKPGQETGFLRERFRLQPLTRREEWTMDRVWPRGAPPGLWSSYADQARSAGRRREEAFARARLRGTRSDDK